MAATAPKSFKELYLQILDNGTIDAEEVEMLRARLYADGRIERVEAEFLLELHAATARKFNASSWGTFFVDAMTAYLVQQRTADGSIDEYETKWIIDALPEDWASDEAVIALLRTLKRRVPKLNPALARMLEMVDGR